MKKNRTFKNFADWHPIDIENKLGIIKKYDLPQLAEWIKVDKASLVLPDELVPMLTALRLDLDRFRGDWNEAELVFYFISPFLNSVRFRGKNYNFFLERSLSAKINGYEVHGIVDGMVASGSYEPETPYFFLHEYKRFKGTEADPLGQLLIAMVASQQQNEDPPPIYGCYVTGKFWSFVVLEGNTYSESQAYDATNEEELNIIWLILNKTKGMIETLVQREHEERT